MIHIHVHFLASSAFNLYPLRSRQIRFTCRLLCSFTEEVQPPSLIAFHNGDFKRSHSEYLLRRGADLKFMLLLLKARTDNKYD